MLRRASAIVAVLCVLCFGVRVASAATYTLTDLGAAAGGGMGYVDTYNGQPVVVAGGGWYWTTGGPVNLLPLLPGSWGATGCTAVGVNSSGQIDGSYTSADGTGYFVYTIGGTAQQINLPSEPFITTSVEGITNIGENGSVALYYGTGTPPGVAACPAVFNANTQAFTYPGGTATSGTGYGVLPVVINANGWIAGDNTIAEVWDGSAWNNITQLAGSSTNYPYAIDSNGDIVGKAIQSGYNAFYAPYDGGGTWGTPINLFSGTTKGVAYGINDGQMIVGTTGVNVSAYIWTSPTAASGVALSALVTPSSLGGWTLMAATGINNGDDIVGWGTNPSGTQNECFLLTPLAGDANLDGQVDINDLTVVLTNYGRTGATWNTGDFIGDGRVDINDLTIVLAHYGHTAGASASGPAAAPEPSALALSAVALFGLLAYAWKKRG
jgi:hypothetical protein